MLEECGINVTIEQPFYTTEHVSTPNNPYHYVLTHVFASLDDHTKYSIQPIAGDDASKLAWVPVQDVKKAEAETYKWEQSKQQTGAQSIPVPEPAIKVTEGVTLVVYEAIARFQK